MNKDNSKKIISIVLVLVFICVGVLLVFFITKLGREEKKGLKEDILKYLNETYKVEGVSSKSPIYGLLNYNFDSLDSIGTDDLIYTNMMSYSLMNDDGIDSIYMGEYSMNKSSYLASNRYVDNPNMNCYFYQNVLNEKGYNCDSVCSKSESAIMSEMMKKLEFINVLPEDVKIYCKKNALYPIDSNGYFVNLTDLKNLYKSITNKELKFDDKVINNKYYKYDAYLESELLRLEDNINKVSEVNSLKKSNDNYVVSYKALTDSKKELKGVLTLGYSENGYYLISNNIDSGIELD